MKKILLFVIAVSFCADAGWLKNLYQRAGYIGCTRQLKVDTTLASTSSITGALVVPNGGIGAMHVTTDSLRVGSSGSRFKEIKVIDGAADTLSITVGTKTWKLLPVANQ